MRSAVSRPLKENSDLAFEDGSILPEQFSKKAHAVIRKREQDLR
jgi:hypothetical protein